MHIDERIDRATWTRAATVAFLTLLLYGSFVFVQLRRAAFRPTIFVTAGDEFADRTAPRDLIVAPRSSGYDGQFYYRIAREPFSTKPVAWGIHFDYPVYRLQRIGYPLLVWILTFGNPDAVPWMMIAINLVSLAGIAALGVVATNGSSWSGLSLALYPGFLLSISRDLVEPLEIVLVLAALVLLDRGRVTAASLFLILAALTKETSLLIPTGALLAAMLIRPRRWTHLLLLTPFLAHIGWKLLLFRLWHLPVTFVTGEHFMLPFRGFLSGVRDAVIAGAPGRVVLLEMVTVVVFGIVVMAALSKSTASTRIKLSWALYAALVFTLGAEFWWEDWAFLRVAVEFTILGGVIATTSPRTRRLAQSLLTLGWVALACNLLWFRG